MARISLLAQSQIKFLFVALAGLALAACAGTPAFNITRTQAEDSITYQWANDTATFDITSPGGIGGARMVQTSGSKPKRILLQLRFKGLESLKFRFEDGEVNVSVSSSDSPVVRASARTGNGAEMEIGPDSEYWMSTEIVSVSETVPLVDGYFRVELPSAFYAGDAREFSLEWTDFFR